MFSLWPEVGKHGLTKLWPDSWEGDEVWSQIHNDLSGTFRLSPKSSQSRQGQKKIYLLKKSNEGKDSTSLSKLAVVGKKIRGFKIYFVNFLLLHQLSSFVEGLRLTGKCIYTDWRNISPVSWAQASNFMIYLKQ